MITNEGRFKQFDSEEEAAESLKTLAGEDLSVNDLKLEMQRRYFRVGEELIIKGGKFRVKNITPTKLILKLVEYVGHKEKYVRD